MLSPPDEPHVERPLSLAVLMQRELGTAVSPRQFGFLIQAVYALRNRFDDRRRPTEADAAPPDRTAR